MGGLSAMYLSKSALQLFSWGALLSLFHVVNELLEPLLVSTYCVPGTAVSRVAAQIHPQPS